MSRRNDPRIVAVRALGDVLDEGRSLAETPAFQVLKQARDQGFSRHLTYGVLRWLGALEWLSGKLLDRPLKRKDRDIQRLIYLGLFQAWQDETADHAAVHATAEAARGLRKAWAVGLVNAVLRRFLRERNELLSALQGTDHALAHPPWLLEMLREDWPDQWQALAEANNRQAPLQLRVNQQRLTREVALERLRDAGLNATPSDLAPTGITVAPAVGVDQVPGFMQGDFSVQDFAAQLAAELLDAQPGDRVLDACAAPGGKTGHLLEREANLQLLALDLSSARLERVRENLDRLNLTATLKAGDAAQPDEWWDSKPFDRILLDAPCSATGVIRRHPEIKWLRDREQVDQAVALQARLLQALWPLLRPGGILVYATCSVLRRENHQQIQAFLQSQPDARCIGPEGFGEATEPGRQLLPGREDTDGFYYAVLHRAP